MSEVEKIEAMFTNGGRDVREEAGSPASPGTGRACGTCGKALGRRFYEADNRLACRPCAVKVNPARVALDDRVYDSRGIYDGTAVERVAGGMERWHGHLARAADGSAVKADDVQAMAALAAGIGSFDSVTPREGAVAAPSGNAVQTLASMLDGDPEATAKGLPKGGDAVSALASLDF